MVHVVQGLLQRALGRLQAGHVVGQSGLLAGGDYVLHDHVHQRQALIMSSHRVSVQASRVSPAFLQAGIMCCTIMSTSAKP